MEQISIDKKELEIMVSKIENYEKDISDLIYVAESIIRFLGLTDEQTGKIKTEYLTGEEKPMPAILKSAGNLVILMSQAQVPVLGKKAEKQIEEKFAFIQRLLPLLKKYS